MSRYIGARRLFVTSEDWFPQGKCWGRTDLTEQLFSLAPEDLATAARDVCGVEHYTDAHDRPAIRLLDGHCPVAGETGACASYAIANGCDHGVWGGLLKVDRERLLRRARKRQAAVERMFTDAREKV